MQPGFFQGGNMGGQGGQYGNQGQGQYGGNMGGQYGGNTGNMGSMIQNQTVRKH